jgi:hypothetical protein
VTLTRGSTDQFNDPDLGLDTEYVLDVGSSTFVANVNDSTWETLDSYWATAQDAGETLYQTRYLTADITTTTADITDLKFENLTIGKKYRLTIHGLGLIQGDTATEIVRIAGTNGAQTSLAYWKIRNDGSNDANEIALTSSEIFTATASTVIIDCAITGTNTLRGNDNNIETWAQLEELPQHTETTKFTP